ncbi:Mannosyl oligosaccharide glucosidase [Planctomycetales bacterium 10988]|nr:Mannosyl oligosaccharide glucosidase [Planctomycetales bacterium 10988]
MSSIPPLYDAHDPESERLHEDTKRTANWKRWGPYLSERQWGTVREDYSPEGTVWKYFTHDQARSRAYRWGEDGLLGICDRECRLCFGLALWNEKDPILKERLFGLTGPEGNHGEDVKELYYYLESTPTHSYMKALYKYPQAEYPYQWLLDENKKRGYETLEFELMDTGIFQENRYFDVYLEYAKGSPNDILMQVTVVNQGPDTSPLYILPTLWFRNGWSWGCRHEGCDPKPVIQYKQDKQENVLDTYHHTLGHFKWSLESIDGVIGGLPEQTAPFLFTDNVTNQAKLYNVKNFNPYVKDAFHRYIIHQEKGAVNPRGLGTKVTVPYRFEIPSGEQIQLRFRLFHEDEQPKSTFGVEFENTLKSRIKELETFYDLRCEKKLTKQEHMVMRQSQAGLLWTKQFYHYSVADWLKGDEDQVKPPESRETGRNSHWQHLFARDVISMPDKWEYPWFAAWDTAFHMIPFAKIDAEFAKEQMILFLREWYMDPNGQIPAYEWDFGDVNPPVHAWAVWRIYKMTGPRGKRDRLFLARCFQKLLLNFTWWANRKDIEGHHIFEGGFLGLDNIGVFDRSQPLPTGGHLRQADGTAWMAFYCSTMLAIALELAKEDRAYGDMASKFFEHFVTIADAINELGGSGLWNEEDGFYYDYLNLNGEAIPLKVRSLVGLSPLFAVEILDNELIRQLPGFSKRLDWFLKYRTDLAKYVSYCELDQAEETHKARRLLAIPSQKRLKSILRYLFDEKEFLSPYGIRSLSKVHAEQPYVFHTKGREYRVDYQPGESQSGMFGGNSNWRGPIWFPMNFLLIEALERFHHFYGDSFKVEYPTGSGNFITLKAAAHDITQRLISLFLPNKEGARPCHGEENRYRDKHDWKDLVLFYEYFHAESGRGLGASHQTGWTALVGSLLDKHHREL